MFELIDDIKSLKQCLISKELKKIFLLLVLMVFEAFLTAVGVGVVPVYVSFLLNPSIVAKVIYLSDIMPVMPAVVTPTLAIIASLILILVISLKNIVTIFITYVQLRFVYGVQARMGERMFAIYQSASYEWLLGTNSSELVRKIQHDTSEIANRVLMSLLELVKNTLILLFIVGVMMAGLQWPIMVILGMMSLGFFGLQAAMRKKIKETGHIIRREIKNNIQNIQQGFGAIIDTRLLMREEYVQKGFKKSVRRAAKARWTQGTLMRSIPPLIEILSVMVLLSAFLLQVNINSSFEESLPGLTLLVVAVTRLKQISSQMAHSLNNIQAGKVYLPGLVQDIEKHTKKGGIQNAKKVERIGIRFNRMKLNDVSYSYGESKKPAIKHIDISVSRGDSIGLIGSTGSGKSTLVNVILGLLVPQYGEVKVNGVALRDDKSEWWKMIGYVPQSIYLIDNTIRANIAFGIADDEIDKHRLANAVRSAQLERFIDELPEGLDTIVGERGVKLSGGQKQRIGIARALYPDPQVLVMDEATSALDTQTEKELMQTIESLMGEKTMVMIAHRLTTLEKCDRLYVLEKGELVSVGTYDDMMTKVVKNNGTVSA